MKIRLLSTTILFVVLISAENLIAQTTQGSWTFGGGMTLSFQNNKVRDGSTTIDLGNTSSFGITPSAGYFIQDGLAVGASLRVGTTKFNSDNGGTESSSSSVNFGPFVKYYHESGVFGRAGIGFGTATVKTESDFGNAEITSSSLSWSLSAGYAHFLNEHISVEPFLSYNSVSVDPDTSNGESKNITGGINLGVGFVLFLNKE